ncbi:MAG TPA: AAA family ATPase, partial [Bacteroidota bacterium]|nr:AAA family ATPase [Bacteroidota bacterium]
VDVRSEIERKKAKVDFLKGLIETREGLSEGVRYLTQSTAWKPSRNVTVADAVHADRRYLTAIEASLGEYAGLIIVDSARDAERGMALLRQDQRGKATFVCLDRLPHIRSRSRLPAIAGVHGWAADLAHYERPYAALFRAILDRTLIVEDLPTAQAVAQRLTGVRCVTLEGEIITGAGIARGGSRRQDEGGMIGKQKQIEDLEEEIAALSGRLAGLEQARAEAAAADDAVVLKKFTDEVKAIEKEMNGVEMRIAQLAFEKKRATDIIERNGTEASSLSAELADLAREIAQTEPDIASLKEGMRENDRNLGSLGAELQSLEHEWNERSTAVNDLGIVLATVRGDLQSTTNDLKRMDERTVAINDSLAGHDADLEQCRNDIVATRVLMGGNADVIEGMQGDLTAIEARREAVEKESVEVREAIHAIELAIKDQRRTHDDALAALHDVEMKIADLTAKAEHIRARAREEFEYTVERKQYPDDEFVDFAAIREEIAGLRDKIKGMGNINFAAFEEYKTEKERYEFLTTQRKDLLEAEKTLLATIEEINTTAQRKFLDTFGKIRQNFIETFKSLFDPGDECDLRLEEEVDPLEARIDIIAKPRGKRPTSIDLLSGGEKTLTATALLFAIYLVKPSPFCILDEVDAPLDDANIDRFTRILRKFSDNTQFIVVTHNKRTMEAANALYGVTMEEEGVSKLVSVRFSQGAEIASAAIASA